jgi:acyl transferase domain-containing protein/NADPH:quinone reductase-like Zn-dependent oxidoreductase
MGNDGRSFSFDARGTGYGRGEGCGMILLKPLDQAVKDNDCIRAVIAASGVNQDGHTPGITMPNGESQESLVRAIYQKAGLNPSQTGYVEAHGTGTRVGDPIEVTALHNVFNEGRTPRNPLYLGSVKSNIGHLESASGILAVIKTAVMLDRGFLLPNYDFKVGNHKIPFTEWGLKVPVRQLPWPRGKRFASINNFGFGGTNAHVVMERAPVQTSKDNGTVPVKEDPAKKVFVLSAADKATCQTLLTNLVVYLEQRPEMFQRDLMSNVAYTLGQRRSLLPWRVAVPATESFQLIETISKGTIQPVKETGSPRIGFVCTGQGAQWWAMGRELYGRYPVFKDTIDNASAILAGLDAPYDLVNELSLDEHTTRVNQAHISQPACTAIQLALIELLRAWGILPVAVIGHSSGEIAAAYAAGILSIDSAMLIAYHRGRLIPVLKAKFPELQGTMMAVGCGKEEIGPLIQQLRQKEARIACYNSPQSLTISGDTPAINELSQVLEENQIFNRKLVIETAYHSHHMELIADEYHASIQHLPQPEQSRARFFSSLSGKEASYSELDASYWVRNLTNPVKFAQACANLVAPSGEFATGVDMIIEIGPHAALQGPVKQILKAAGGPSEKISYAGTLSRKKDAIDTMLDLASTLFCKGSPLDLGNVNFPKATKTPSLLVDLPRYPWNHSRKYWHESRIAKMHKHREFPRHDLLGTLANYSNDLEPTWRNILRLDDIPWLRHHRIQDLTIFPISAFVGMVVEATAQQAKSRDIDVGHFVLHDVNVQTPLIVPDDSVELTITLRSLGISDSNMGRMYNEFLIHSYSQSKGWTLNCTGTVAVKTTELNEVDGPMQAEKEAAFVAAEISRMDETLSTLPQSNIYNALESLGVAYGSTFQGLSQCRGNDKYAIADITVADTEAEMPDRFETKHFIHPSLLEQLIQMYWPILGAGRAPLDVACLPASIGRITISARVVEHTNAPGKSLHAFSKATKPLSTEKPSMVSMFAVVGGETMIAIDDLTVAPLPATDVENNIPPPRELCFKQTWEQILTPPQEDGHTRVDSPSDTVSNGTTLPATTPITIIHGTCPEQVKLAGMLAASLESLGVMKVDLGALEDINPVDKNIICLTELHESILSTLEATQFRALQTITQASQSLLWLTRGAYGQNGDPTANMVSGFSRAIRSENMFKFATLDLDAEQKLDETGAVQAILKIFQDVVAAETVVNHEMEFQERKGEFWTPRIVNDDAVNTYVHRKTFPPAIEDGEFGGEGRSLKMAICKPGLLDSLYFVDDEQRNKALLANEIEIQVGAVALSSRDVQAALGHIDAEVFGNSCSGVVSCVGSQVKKFIVGDTVAAFTQGAAFATFARANEDFVLKLQPGTSLESAASLPVAYCSAYHALADLARLEDDESILILNAAGSVGQAAILLAQSIGATVFATVETAAEKALLQRLDLPEEHIFHNKHDQLSISVLRQTAQREVDVVLSIQADASCNQAAVSCLSDFGRFVLDNSASTKTAFTCLHGNSALYSFDLHSLASQKPRMLQRLIKDVSRSLKYGKLRPIEPTNVFSIAEVSQAFKLARSGLSSNNIVIVPHHDDVVRKTRSKQVIGLFNPNATYILIGGTGGLGRGMTRWMASKGARHIVLLSRRGAVVGPVKTLVDDLASAGVSVHVHSCDVAKRGDVDKLLEKSLEGLPPIRGVIHGAMTLRVRKFLRPTRAIYIC